MLELLAVSTGIELGKLVLEQILDLGKPVLEGYVQDFFKDCLNIGAVRLNAAALKTPMAEAIGCFIKRFIKELQINDVPETSIHHHYKAAIKRFVQDKTVRPILGKAFEKDCKQIAYVQLERIWTQHYQVAGWQFPGEEFNWRGVGKEFVYEVKSIIKANSELRSLLETELLENIAQNTAQISPGFDIEKYRESLQFSYGYLKLYTLDSTDRVDAIKLWNIFIEQTVREALPPMRYELPLDLKRKLREEGQLEEDLSVEALELYRREYFQQPARKVLEVVGESQHTVVLGDPGSGKSTLLQFLALEWVEDKVDALPLLIELREYVLAKSHNFLDFLHRGSGADWQFDQQQLQQHLLENPTLVMFDGLDEVFDRPTQSSVIDDIIRFVQQYPQARVLVTSRIIGYNPERFQHAGFRQLTIQPLNESEIHKFIDCWYDLSMGIDSDRVRLKQRLKEAIANSRAIQNLADNPLLLTMTAILNRRQELPRDRADLYDQASRVLLYHWDVDHKRLQLPMDAIGRREKQEMLRLIAYEMQAGEGGLKGNLLSADRLIRILTDYLRNQGFSEPREKANRLLQQLRERNFILCYRGADTYGFMHRTFLEYFCAVEIVHRFEKQRILTFERLRDEVFGQHWQDETWHEVLRLICGLIDINFSDALIDFLLGQTVNRESFIDSSMEDFIRLDIRAFTNLLLASDCLSDVGNSQNLSNVRSSLLEKLKTEIDFPRMSLTFPAAFAIFDRILEHFPDSLEWVKQQTGVSGNHSNEGVGRGAIQSAAVNAIARHNKTQETLNWLKTSLSDDSWPLRRAATWAIPQYYNLDKEALSLLKRNLQKDDSRSVRCATILVISRYYPINSEIFDLFYELIKSDPFSRRFKWQDNPRKLALEFLINQKYKYLEVLNLLKDRAKNDPDEQLRQWARKKFKELKKEGEDF
ncbi:MAG: NACHT domain-containing protein [Leptolyngbyaceae cyanobacterium MO_188.B28]|nr:NACHT domain-containing protein [Leptolyngbyaceae cyanobacterium MO_188.B28]